MRRALPERGYNRPDMNIAEITGPEKKLLKPPSWRRKASRLLVGFLGLIFITAAISKSANVALFIRQIRDYGIVVYPLALAAGAWGLIALEFSLGVALLIHYRSRLILTITGALLMLFLGASGWAWFTGTTDACGCFGSWLQRTPGEAFLESMILLFLTVLGLACYDDSTALNNRFKPWAIACALLIGLALPAVSGFPLSKIGVSRANEFDLDQVYVQGVGLLDLEQGGHIIVLTDTECLHCRESVPDLNILAEAEDLPPLIALCTNDEEKRVRFVEEYEPVFPIIQIREDDFWRLLGDGDIPRTMLVRDRRLERVWDETIPDTINIE